MSGSEPGAAVPAAVSSGSAGAWLGAILLAALLLRLAMALTWSLPLGGDEVDYDRLGASVAQGAGIVDGEGHPSSFRPPAYPALVGCVYAAVGRHPTAVRIVQAVAGAATVLLVFLLGRTVLGPAAALVAAGLVAVDFGQIAVVGRLLSEGTFTTVLVGLVLVNVGLVRRLRGGSTATAAALATGGLGALGALLRGILLPYPLLVAGALLWEGRRAPGRWARAALLVVVAWGLVLAPWAVRNALRQHAFVPVTTQVGITFYSAQNPPEGRLFGLLAHDSVVASVAGLPEPEQSRILLHAGLRSLGQAPGRIPRLEAMKTLFFVVPFDWEVLPRYGVLNPTYAFLALWALVAVWLAWRAGTLRRAAVDRWPVWLPVLFFFGMALVFYGSPRLRLPVEPLLALPAGWALIRLGRRLGHGRAAALAVATFVPLLGAFLLGDQAKAAVRALMRATGLWS